MGNVSNRAKIRYKGLAWVMFSIIDFTLVLVSIIKNKIMPKTNEYLFKIDSNFFIVIYLNLFPSFLNFLISSIDASEK